MSDAALPDAEKKSPETLSAVLAGIADQLDNDPTPQSFTLGELLDAVGRRAYGPLLLVIGLFAVSPATIVPGLTWFAAALTFLVAGQMAMGRKTPWLPAKMLETTLPQKALREGLAKADPWAKRVDLFFKPRLLFLSHPPFVNVVALCCLAAALITFPLSIIPIAPIVPSLAITILGLGMTARDGIWLAGGIGLFGSGCALAWPLIF